MVLTSYGRRELVAASAILVTAFAISAASAVWVTPWLWIVAAVPGSLWIWVVAFFRDPDRQPPEGEHLLVSSADGCVSDITPIGPDSALGCEGVSVGVFMSIFNVHVNRCPLGARIERVEHSAGLHLDVRDPEGWHRNESATIYMTCRRGEEDHPLVVRQVAGLLARRIVTDAFEGQTFLRGQRIGMIQFGSRVEVMVPAALVGNVCITVGQKVSAGRTVLIDTAANQEARDDG